MIAMKNNFIFTNIPIKKLRKFYEKGNNEVVTFFCLSK